VNYQMLSWLLYLLKWLLIDVANFKSLSHASEALGRLGHDKVSGLTKVDENFVGIDKDGDGQTLMG